MADQVETYLERYQSDEPRRDSQRDIIKKKVTWLSHQKENFTLKIVNGNYTLSSELWNETTFRKGVYSPNELNFFKAVRKYVMSNSIYLRPQFYEQILKSEVRYIDVARISPDTVIENVIEIDIDEAYWKTALLLDIIDGELYSRGKKGKISKQARMTALGTLAKKIDIYKFERGSVKHSIESDPLLENLWFTICKRLSDVMTEASNILKDDFIFFWVDGIYLKKTQKNIDKITKLFNKKGYGVKYKDVDKVVFSEKGFTTYDKEEESESTRYFNYPSYHSKVGTSYSESLALEAYINDVLSNNIKLPID